MNGNIRTHRCILFFLLLIFVMSCKKLVEVHPPITSTNGDNVFNDDATAISVMTGIFANMSSSGVGIISGRLKNICFTTGLTGDELMLYNPNDLGFGPYFNNSISPNDLTWDKIYNMIFIANSAIEKLPEGTLLTPAIKTQLLGEAKFVRALCYFYLVNLYGDVPLAISTNYQVNRLLPRKASSEVYQQIIKDLIEAQGLLTDGYLSKSLISTTVERVRPNKWAASALLARTYLYIEDYRNAELQSNYVISNSLLYKLVDLNSAFLMNNNEAIWQLQPIGISVNNNANTQEGALFDLHPLPRSSYIVYLNEALVNSFDIRDERKTHWINNIDDNGKTLYFPYKYKIGNESGATTEYSTVLRLGEQYLIRAEARIHLGKIADGISDLNKIRSRATDLTAPLTSQLNQLPSLLTMENAILAVENERKFELFTEWGHRWMDLKRTNRIDAVLSTVKTGYQPTDKLFPIPQGDISNNPSLIGHQNPGY